ncbi:DUF1516 family protein [Alteribacter populi]|uniref:DUF1516 family protein n=1 Tax=Alteribacter populi TaxID=2011011 RepID=UPI000BBB2B2C|nr:DUF1516 family protein [Alteribacter populi]
MAMLHTHALGWFVAIILFVVTVILLRTNRSKGAKIVQMTLRLFYVIVIVTGAFMVINNFWWGTGVKALLAVWLIYTMEMISTRMKKGTLDNKGKMIYWSQFGILLIIVLYFGYVVTG